MTNTQIIELVAAAGLILLSVVVYRRQAKTDGSYGSQGSVIVLFIAILLIIHGLGLMEYRPSQGEIDEATEYRVEQ